VAYKRKDSYYQRAKAAGFRSRAAYKLQEIAQADRLFRRGDRVIDVGAWPGGWLQVALQFTGPEGRLVGCDLRPIDPIPGPVTVLAGDITSPEIQRQILDACGGRADVILSDLAPQLSGIRDRDEARAAELVDCVLEFVGVALRPGGSLVVKLFMNPSYEAAVRRLQSLFRRVRTTRPEATRKGSAELYAVASGYRGPDIGTGGRIGESD
jgi:23S rRNA (uridine2552-2'-O)-methyltransferase